MIIENSPFEDYPIEFKEINPSDFHSEAENGINSFNIENNGSKAIIETNAEGYINDAFQEAINLDRKNTVVVNAAVGQGKSTAIINTLKKYYEKMRNGEDKYLMIVASPFVSLVKQYVNEIEKAGIPANEIYNYNKLGRDRENYRTRCVQVVTVNTLLGNPGEDGFKNSDVKRKYLNELVSDAKRYEKKVIFIYDEVHDSYHNFKSEFIYNLWKWREVIHKNFILSATYNEASKVVIKYLAELTENRLLLIESKRKRREKQSELFLHFSNSYRFTSHMDELQDLIEDLLNRERNIDILSYSKSLAKDILNPKEKLGKLLIDRFGELNDCTSQLIMNNRNENEEPKNQFDNNKCNVGTNFKTGVSIKKSNHSYIIILPPRFTRDFFRNKFGIFSGGINSVIQALARQRRPGEIHLILAKPDKFNFESLPFSNWTQDQMLFFARIYKYVQYSKEPPNGLVKYFKINRQNELIKDFYQNELLENVKNEINFISEKNRSNLPKLQYPTYDEFLLEKGEDYLANNYQFFGEDISSYITYAALTNQFSNCKLSFIGNKITLYFRKETILEDLSKFYRDYVDEYYSRHFTNFNFFYLDLRTRIFKDFGLRYLHFVNSANGTEEKWKPLRSYQIKWFEIGLILFASKVYFLSKEVGDGYSRSEYFLDSINASNNFNLDELEDNDTNRPIINRIKLYRNLSYFRNLISSKIQPYTNRNEDYLFLPQNYFAGFFSEDDISKFREIESLLESDKLLDNNVFEFKRRLSKNTELKRIKAFYKILLEDFVEYEDDTSKINFAGARRIVLKVKSSKFKLHLSKSINLVEPAEYVNEEQIPII